MQGLYKKALGIRESQRYLRLLRPDELGEDDDLDISPEERKRILAQIDNVVEGSRIRIGPDTFVVKPKRAGAVLPLFVNLIAIVVMVAGAYVLVRWFNSREDSISTERSTLSSAEGRLLTALKAESEQQLSRKEQEISQIQNRLSDLNAERDQLTQNSASQLQEREDELRSEFESLLETERQRLAEGGLSQAEIDQQIADFEASQRARYEADLEAARQQAASDLAQREETLNTLLSDVQLALSAAEQERVDLQAELADQEERLVQQFQTETAELEQERSAALAQLQQLSEQQDREQLVLDQIVSFYTTAQSQITRAAYADALETLESLKGYLGDRSVMELPAVRRRLQVELFLVDSLQSLVSDEAASANPDTQSLVESAQLVAEVADLVEAADASFADNNYEQARQLYESALGRIPAVQVGLTRLNEIRALFDAQENAQVAGLIELGNQFYIEDQFDRAAVEYDRALSALPAYDAELLSRILNAGYQLRTTRELDDLRSVRAELEQLQVTLLSRDRTIEQLRAQVANLENREAALAQKAALLENQVTGLLSDAAARDEAVQTAVSPEPDPQLVAELEAAQATISVLEDDLASLRSDALRLQGDLANRDAQLRSRLEELTAVQTDLEDARADLAAAREDGTETTATLQESDDDLAAIQASLATVQAELAQAKSDLSEANDRLSRLSDMEADLARISSELSATTEQVASLEAAGAEIAAALASTQTERDAARAERDAAQAERDTTRTDLAAAQTRLGGATSEIARLLPFEGAYNEQQALLTAIASYRQRFSSAPEPTASDTVSALELLETKLLILRIIDSEPVRTEHPDLFDDLNIFLEALVTEQRAAAVKQTLLQVQEVLDEILAGETAPSEDVSEVLDSPAYGSILDRIRTIADPDER